MVRIVEVADFDNNFEKNGVDVEQKVAFLEVKAIEGKARVDSLYILYQASSEGEDRADALNDAFHFLLQIVNT